MDSEGLLQRYHSALPHLSEQSNQHEFEQFPSTFSVLGYNAMTDVLTYEKGPEGSLGTGL